MTEMTEDLYLAYVDVHGSVHADSSDNELALLEELYGAPDEDGVFRGEGN